MTVVLRPATMQDWQVILSLAEAIDPDSNAANLEWLANRKKFDTTRYVRKHYLASDGEDRVIGYGAIEQGPGVQHYRVFLVIEPGLGKTGVWQSLFDRLEQDLRDLKANRAWAREYTHGNYSENLEFFLANGFHETHRVNSKLPNGADAVMVRVEREL